MKIKHSFFAIGLIILFAACETTFLPKPKGYNRINMPEVGYVLLPDTFPYQFEYSQNALLLKDTSWLSERYWIDIHYPDFEAFVQITYKPINKDSLVDGYLADSYRLTSQHNVKAYAIEEKILLLQSGNVASVSELEGDVPTQFQFHITDSSKHFLRGALYFQTATKNDSLKPAIDFIKNDLVHLLNTLTWQ
ncbi:MAG: gliding motility-associated lipoprotein GldD [Cyclobacteriaceae bacterium]|jgi:gliding motility-associated lipoprotein GldD